MILPKNILLLYIAVLINTGMENEVRTHETNNVFSNVYYREMTSGSVRLNGEVNTSLGLHFKPFTATHFIDGGITASYNTSTK